MPDIGLGGTLSIRIVLTYSAFAVMVVSTNTLVTQSKANIGNSTTPVIKAMLDPKRRNELIDEAFLEQKDMLLDMLESKLKEVRDKKKKTDQAGNTNETESQCESKPKNVDVVLKGHGISGIGETDVRLKYGEDGNGTLSLDATGISNVGKVHVELGVADGNVHIPGLDHVFTGEMLLKEGCKKNKKVEVDTNTLALSKAEPHQENLDDKQTTKRREIIIDREPERRVNRGEEKLDIVLPMNETSNYVDKPESNGIQNSDNLNNNITPTIDDNTTLLPEETKNTTEVVNNTDTFPSSNA